MEEMLNIVDADNNPTGETRPRSEVHSTGLWHRTAHIYLFRHQNNQIEILTHLRSKFKDGYPNTWDTRFGGHIRPGLSMEQGAVGELKEELGMDIQVKDLLEGEWRKRDKGLNREFTKVFYLEFNGNLEDLSFEDNEVQKVKWMTVSEIEESMIDHPEIWSGSPEGFKEILSILEAKI